MTTIERAADNNNAKGNGFDDIAIEAGRPPRRKSLAGNQMPATQTSKHTPTVHDDNVDNCFGSMTQRWKEANKILTMHFTF